MRTPNHERGMSESVSWALLVPVIMLCLLGLIQGAIWVNGRTVATNAALAAAESQALLGAGSGDGERVALEIAVGGGLEGVTVGVTRSSGLVTVAVSGHVQSLVGGDLFSVQARASRPVEGA